MFLATVLGITSNAALNAMQLQERKIADTEEYFRQIALLVNEHIVMQDIQVPFIPGENATDSVASPNNIVSLLLDSSIVRGTNWAWNQPVLDPWGRSFFIFRADDYHAISGGGGNVVQPQISAFVMASPGPDMNYENVLQAALGNLAPGVSNVNDVLSIEADPNSDDIVYTFSTASAVEERWEMVEWNVRQLALTYLDKYKQGFSNPNFMDTLDVFYKNTMDQFFTTGSTPWGQNTGGGTYNLNENALASWQNPSGGLPNTIQKNLELHSPNMINMAGEVNQMQSGDNSYITFLENNSTTTGVQLTATSWSTLGAGAHDRMRVEVTASGGTGTAWQNAAGTMVYRVEIGN